MTFPPSVTARTAPRREWIAALVAVAICVAGVSAVLLRTSRSPDDAAVLAQGRAPAPPGPLPPGTSYIKTRVLPSGALAVRQWIHTDSVVFAVTMTTPSVVGLPRGTVRVTRVFLAGDAGPQPIVQRFGPRSLLRTLPLPPTRRVYLRYRLSGVVDRSEGADGRALARITSLDVATASSVRTTQSVVGARVLSLACTPEGQTEPTPCGTVRGGVWSAQLGLQGSSTQVMAQLDLAGTHR